MSNNNPILKIGQEVLFIIGLYQKEEKLHKKRRPIRSVISVIWVRFELTTHGLEDRCSIQLSYQTSSLTEHILV